MDIINVIGISAGVLTATSLLPQLIKIIKEKKAEDVSLWMLFILLAGIGLWTAYGIMKKDPPIIYTNMFSFLINCIIIVFRFKYKKKGK